VLFLLFLYGYPFSRNFSPKNLEAPVNFCRGYRALAVTALLIAGCGSSAEDSSKERLAAMAGGRLKDVVPVSGKVLVDGAPTAGVNLHLFPSAGGNRITSVKTGPDGTYCWSTHTSCDGIEAGSYKIAFDFFKKPKRNDNVNMADDQLKGRYSDPMKSEFSLTVTKGTPQKDVNYELKTK
jgi:hypothetical protein